MLILVLLAVAGLVFGSFVGALVWRIHEQVRVREKNKQADISRLSILRGRSMCPHCKHELAPQDLVPLLSWLALRGRCRYCRKPIAWQDPVVELLTSALFVVSYLAWPLGTHGLGLVQLCFWLVFVVGFVALAVYDLKWYILPDRIIFPMVGLAVIQIAVALTVFHAGWLQLMGSIWGIVFASGIFFLLYQVSDGKWIGGGDVKLGLLLGLIIGGPMRSLLLLFLASLLGTLVSLPMLAVGKAKRTTLIPFGPFLIAAAFIIELFGSHFAV